MEFGNEAKDFCDRFLVSVSAQARRIFSAWVARMRVKYCGGGKSGIS